MNYIKITTNDIANGPSIRCTLWVSGCDHACPGCHNPETWNPATGKPFDESAMYIIEEQLNQPWCAGLTLSGGDPLYPDNRNTIAKVVAYFKEYYPNKTIWMWTGYTWPEIAGDKFCMQWILPYIDVLVDSPFIQEERDITLEWRGSKNQRIIDVQKTLQHWDDAEFKILSKEYGVIDKIFPRKIYLWKNGEYK